MASDLDPQLCLTIYPARGMKSGVRSKGKGEGCGSRPVLRAGNSIHLGECVICGGIIHNFLLRRVLRPAKLIAKKRGGSSSSGVFCEEVPGGSGAIRLRKYGVTLREAPLHLW